MNTHEVRRRPKYCPSQRRASIHRLQLLTLLAAAVLTALPASAIDSFQPASPMSVVRSFFTATLLPGGKVLYAGGETTGGAFLLSAEVYDPLTGQVAATGSMFLARASQTATVLPNGKVLVAGGRNDANARLQIAELYDPATGGFTATDDLNGARYGHTATLLSNGDVLIAGGDGGTTAEIYDHETGVFSPTGSMTSSRIRHTATLLPNGKVLMTGGSGAAGAELYDPATGTFAPTGNMSGSRIFHAATLLPNGKVLVAGGSNGSASLASAELYDPSAGTFAATGSMSTARRHLTATLLPDGNLLVTGGTSSAGAVASAEIYESSSGLFVASAASSSAVRSGHTATLLPDARVLIAGGGSSTVDLFDYAAPSVSSANVMNSPREHHTATILPDGRVLLAGGSIGEAATSSAEIYDAASDTFTTTGSMSVPRQNHTATLLPNGLVLVAGGNAATPVELYDPSAGTFGPGGDLLVARSFHVATLLRNGLVLLSGGAIGTVLSSTELFDPATGSAVFSGPMTEPRMEHRATLLRDGRVLVTGGSSLDLYDPAGGTFASLGDTLPPHHTATLLADGSVLFTGTGGSYRDAWRFDPATNTTSFEALTIHPHDRNHTATLLPTGRVLIVSDRGNELYDPASSSFAAVPAMVDPRTYHTTTRLPGGEVLIAGGRISSPASVTDRAELFDGGTGYPDSRRPLISSVTGTICQPANLALAGSSFRSDSEGGTGGVDSSSGNTPMLRLQRIDNGDLQIVQPLLFTATSIYSTPVSDLATGSYRTSVVSNGIPSNESIIRISTAPLLGTFASATVNLGGSVTVAALSSPPDFNGELYPLVTSSPSFDGGLSVNGETSAVNVTNAGPTGDHEVTVSATTVCGSASTTFALSVIGPPSSMTATSGTPQTQRINTAFALPLQVTVKDSAGHPLKDVSIVFDAPDSGAGATLSSSTPQTNASGVASVIATANGIVGSYDVTAILGDMTATFALTNTTSPSNVVATATTATSVAISWTASGGVTYEVQRQASGGTTSVGTTAGGTLNDNAAVANTSYLYRVRTVTPTVSAWSVPDLATTVIHENSTLTAGVSLVRAADFTQLRTAANAVRTLAGLPAYAFADPTLTAGVTPPRVVHLSDLRTALNAARSALSLPAIVFSRPTITAGVHSIAVADVNELRGGAK